MRIIEEDKRLIVRLQKGEEIVESLKKIIKEYNLVGGSVVGIGASDDIEVGCYNSATKEFKSTTFNDDYEITSLIGNVSRKDGEPYVHLHINFSDEEMHTRGGHLNRAVISVTCELFIDFIDEEIGRYLDEETGIYFWDI
ncbi:MAG: DNA-binding protein [Tissierellia bacterium]|nr:DNA-binding protein [Tissierellia bacterium]